MKNHEKDDYNCKTQECSFQRKKLGRFYKTKENIYEAVPICQPSSTSLVRRDVEHLTNTNHRFAVCSLPTKVSM